MAEAIVRWSGGKTFIGTDSTNHSVVMSSTKEAVGMKPSELLLVALAACSSYDVVTILEKRKLVLKKLEVQAHAEQDSEPPWTFIKIHLKYILSGEGLTAQHVEKAIELSEGKYCSVAATLKGKATITWEYMIE
ncbi:MAG: OsmC family protein [Anaerolineaceae bacterium]|nr:OsmC family protein [Anaerolineaceae bacterium]